jgi:eukaryotic-like serine/threonine-protein kinase
MPAPTTATELVELIQKSGVIEAPRLTTYLQGLAERATVFTEPKPFATRLVHDGILTYFQAEQFLLGKWKRFTIGKYKVLERLGIGGMGQVFLCEHKHMRRRVAVKVLPSAKADDPASLERFYREARVVAELDHPNLVRAFDIDQDETLHFLVMEYVDGLSLQEIVRRTGPMDPLRACHYVAQAADGLQYAHEVKSIVHRDIKPGNILVDRSGLVKVLDMGLARFFNDEEDVLTKKYDETVLGTADYLSPEQATDSHGVDVRADIYSLGATFYFMLTGQPPFAGGTVAQKLIAHQTRNPEPVRSLRREVPEGVAAVLEKMMMKDREERYQTPSEIAVALAPYTQVPIPPPSTEELPRLSPAAMGPSGSSSTVTAGRPNTPRSSTPSARNGETKSMIRPVIPAPNPMGLTASGDVLPAYRTPAATPKYADPSPAAAVARPNTSGDSNPYANLLASGASHTSVHNVYATAVSRTSGMTVPQAQPQPPQPQPAPAPAKPWLAFVAVVLSAVVGFVFWKVILTQ